MDILWGIIGIIVILGLAWLFSTNRKAINLRTVFGALGIQLLLAFLVLYWEPGQIALQSLTQFVQSIIDASVEGIDFVFGGVLQAEGAGQTFAFEVLPVIIFFASLISILYYLGVMQWIVYIIGGFISWLLGTSKSESMSASANIFVGQTEAPLTVRPYIANMTRSELFAILTGGLATVAGSVLAGIAAMGVPLDYLIAASFMAAPAGLLMAKIIIPETEKSETSDSIEFEQDEDTRNVIDAAANGASDGLRLALNVGAMLIAFISLLALINIFLGWIGSAVGFEELTLEYILGLIFAPIAFLIGVPWEEALAAGSFIGLKTVLNEFVAYSAFMEQMGALSPKTEVIVTFALCGFANIGSLAILIGGVGGMAPKRRPEIAQLAIRALIAATLANLLSAAVAGMLVGITM